MSTYNKTVWQDGDIITADKMNNIENGIYSYNEDITNLETNKQDVLTFDSAPTAESTNPVTSAGIKTALDSVDTEIGELKENFNQIHSTINSMTLGLDDDLLYLFVNGRKQGDGIQIGGTGTRYTVAFNMTRASAGSPSRFVYEGKPYTNTIVPDTGCEVKSVTVTMGGVTVPNAYNQQTGAVTISSATGDIVITAFADIAPIDLLNVTWANHAITCGQDTNAYNAWSPHNLQYDSVNDCFVLLQCHANRHLNPTCTNWTLSIINPYDSTDYEDITIPAFAGLGMLFVENGVWTLMPRYQNYAYRSSDRGETWETLQANIPQYLFGVYKCGDTYFGGNDKNSGITYYTSPDLLTWTEVSFDSNLGYTTLCETSFCEFDGKYWAFNRTNDSTLGHPVILQSTDEGETWTLFSDQLLHGYRSTISCYPFENYIMIGDIDRDNGVLYYSKFDGTTITELNTWQVPASGDDFHNVNIASNYKDTVILEFMHCVPIYFAGSRLYSTDHFCDNVMLVGSTKALPSFNFDSYIDTKDALMSYANANLTHGVNGGEYEYYDRFGHISIKDSGNITTFVDEVELPLNLVQLVDSGFGLVCQVKNSDSFVVPVNHINAQVENMSSSSNIYKYLGFVRLNNVTYMYAPNFHSDELPILIRVGAYKQVQNTVGTNQNLVTGESWQSNLGVRKVMSVNYMSNNNIMNLVNSNLWNDTTPHKFALVSYTPVSNEVETAG